jgi:hypothetical protein
VALNAATYADMPLRGKPLSRACRTRRAALGVTNAAEWDANSWLSDIVPHLVSGFMSAVAHDVFSGV